MPLACYGWYMTTEHKPTASVEAYLSDIANDSSWSEFGSALILDCSHLSASDLDLRTIELARILGWGAVTVSDDTDLDALGWDAEDAVGWMNSLAPDRVLFVVSDNSLFAQDPDRLVGE